MSGKIKRFYEQASVGIHDGYFTVDLDGRPVKSSRMLVIKLPSADLAEGMCAEWRKQEEFVEPDKMPNTRFAGVATDGACREPALCRAELLKYAHSDLICYRADGPADLVERQQNMWNPVLEQYQTELDLVFLTTQSITHITQDAKVMDQLSRLAIAPLKGYPLGAVHVIALITGSSLLAIALLKGWLLCEQVWSISHLDEDYQAETWGLDEEATLRRQRQFADYDAAVKALIV